MLTHWTCYAKLRRLALPSYNWDTAPWLLFLYKIQQADLPGWERCGRPETTAHFLTGCKAYANPRRIFQRALRRDNIKIPFNNSCRVLDKPRTFPHLEHYIKDTGCFPELRPQARC